MAPTPRPAALTCTILFLSLMLALSATNSTAQSRAWPTHSHDAQHTGVSSVASQPLTKIHWKAPVDLAVPAGEIFIHYGSPVITAANTVIVPVKTGADSFRIVARKGATGQILWRYPTTYQAPFASFLPGMGPALSGDRLFIPDSGGRVIVRNSPNLTTGAVSELFFYGQNNFQADPTVYKQNVQINTPLTINSHGNLFFGFLAVGPTTIGLQSGIARIAANGTGTWASASFLAGDPSITEVAMSCAPALSQDGSILYVAVSSGDFGFGYLLALDSKTLAVINEVRLTDPASGFDATLSDESSASPTVGPDGDVYYGVLENPFPDHNDRGWLLHFNRDLSVEKIPGSFGWDDTASIVDASLVTGYQGSSTYLLMTKYNNYASINTGDGHNRVAILDPNATENDPVIPTTQVMQEVITQLGVTPDPNFPSLPGAVREWCINTAVVDPATKPVIVNSEDGRLYRWDLTSNTLSQVIKLSGGIGEAYTPTLIGADGTVYAINDAILDAIGN
jgi:outer membrane protein assembly factor BamB